MTSIFRSIVHSSIRRSIQIGSFVQQVLSNTWVFRTTVADFTFSRTNDQSVTDYEGTLKTVTTDQSAHLGTETALKAAVALQATVLDDTTSGWAKFNGDGAVPSFSTAAADIKEPSTSSMVIEQGTAAAQLTYNKTVSFTADAATIYGVWLYMPDWDGWDAGIQVGGGITVAFHQGGVFFTDYVTINGSLSTGIGWHLLTFQLQDMIANGAWSDTGTVTGLTVRNDVRGSTTKRVLVNQIFSGLENEVSAARLVFRNDDGLKTVEEQYLPILRNKGYTSSLAIIGNNIGAGPTTMTAEEIQEAYQRRNYINNHGRVSIPLNSANYPTIPEMITEVANGQEDVARWAEPSVAVNATFTYPEGVVGDSTYSGREVLDAVASSGAVAGYGAGAFVSGFTQSRGLPEAFHLPAVFVDAFTLQQVKDQIDKAIRLKQTIILGSHNLVSVIVTSTDWLITDYQATVDFIKTKVDAGELQVMDAYDWGVLSVLWKARLEGVLLEGAATNIVTTFNANPTDLTGIAKSGDAASTLTVVDDTDFLLAAGLQDKCPSGKVFELDDSAGIADAFALVSGNPGSTAAHAYTVYARTIGGPCSLSDANVSSTTVFQTQQYERITNIQAVASASNNGRLTVRATAGATCRFILVQAELGSFPTSVIETLGSTGDRTETDMTRAWPFPANGISLQSKPRMQFDATDGKGADLIIINLSDGTEDNYLRVTYDQTNDQVHCKKRVSAGTEVVVSTAASALNYVKGDQLNVRIVADENGLGMWVDQLAKVSIATGDATTDWAVLMTTIEEEPSFQAMDSSKLWNEARSDSQMENLT
jgi:hypothetical protein